MKHSIKPKKTGEIGLNIIKIYKGEEDDAVKRTSVLNQQIG